VCQGRHYFSFYGLHNEPSGNRERKAKKICESRETAHKKHGKGGGGGGNSAGNRENWLPSGWEKRLKKVRRSHQCNGAIQNYFKSFIFKLESAWNFKWYGSQDSSKPFWV